MPKMTHSSPACLGAVQELLEQALSYGARGGTAEQVMSDDTSYAESWITALEDGHGWKVVRIDPKDAETDEAMLEAENPDAVLARLNAAAEAAETETTPAS